MNISDLFVYRDGVPVKVVDDALLPSRSCQYRRPVSRKKRIRKKFSRNPKNFKMYRQALLYHGVLHVTEDMYMQILRQQKTTIMPVLPPEKIKINLKVV